MKPRKIITAVIATAIFTLPSTLVLAFDCWNPDFSAYRKCMAAELACNSYCTGAALAHCLSVAYSYPFPVEPC